MSIEPYQNFCDVVDELLCTGPDYDIVLLIGDFNLPDVNWGDLSPSSTSQSSQVLVDMIEMYNLAQINRVFNVRGVLLDLVFSNKKHWTVSLASDPVLPVEAAHPPLHFEIPKIASRSTASVTTTYDFPRCNLQEVYNELRLYCGEVFFHIPDSLDFFNKFHKTIYNVILKHTPLKTTGASRFPVWFSAELKSAVYRKKVLHKIYKTTASPLDYLEFNRARHLCKMLSSNCYRRYLDHVNGSIPFNMKTFWSFVKNMKSEAVSCPGSYLLGDRQETDPVGVCNLFADYFSSVFRPSVDRAPQFEYDTQVIISSCSFTTEEVERKLSSLDPFKGTGPDLIPPSALRYCSSVIAPQLTVILNRLLEDGIFPETLKTCYIVPIHKGSNPADVQNYRPIAIQPVLGKIFEGLVLDRISFPFKNVIVPQQHGFTKGRSTVTNLLVYEDRILSAFTHGLQVDSVYIDFSKAFDTISHKHLLAKLEGFGIRGSVLSWFTSYLSNRTFVVKFSGAKSRPFTATSGVPQGSRLGPFLFNLYINDLPDCFNVDCLMFADDVKIFCAIRDNDDCETLQESLRMIEDWCTLNCMRINAAKCSLVSFTRSAQPRVKFDYVLNGSVLTRSTSVRDLGVTFSSDLNPENHIDNICRKALRLLSFVVRASRYGLNIDALNILYKSLVRSTLEYCSTIWCPYQLGHIDRIDKIQRRFVRVVGSKLGYNYLDVPIASVESSLDLLPLSTRRMQADSVLLWKILNGFIDCPDLLSCVDLRASRPTRSNHMFFCHSHPTNYVMYGPLPRMHRIGNQLCQRDFDFFFDRVPALKAIFLS